MEQHFAFLPYLKTRNPVQYRDLLFRSSEDLSGLDPSVASHVGILASMFFLRDDLRIKNVTYAVIDGKDAIEIRKKISDLEEFQALARYFYSAPHPVFGQPFLTLEHGSVFLFHHERVSKYLLWNDHDVTPVDAVSPYGLPDERGEFSGYAGHLDGRSPLWVAPGSRIYPPTAHFWLNIGQNLSDDFEHRMPQSSQAELLYFFADSRRDEQLVTRILSALRWYNRSIALDVPEDQAIVSLAIAFESLLNLPRGKDVTDRFKQAVTLLLGPVARLDAFLEQFYDVRSDLVHSGATEDFMFRATDRTTRNDRMRASQYRSLSAYARHIYQLCLATLAYGGHMAMRRGIATMLRTNAERISDISRTLSDSTVQKGTRLALAAESILQAETFRFVPEDQLELKALVDVVRLAADDFIAAGPSLPQPAMDALLQLATTKDTPPFQTALHNLRVAYEQLQAIPRDIDETRSDRFIALATLLDTAWGYTFPSYFQNKRSVVAGSDPTPPFDSSPTDPPLPNTGESTT